MKRLLMICLLLVFVLAGCGGFYGGTMYSLDDNREMTIEIERSRGGGALRAHDPVKGEEFEGTYTCVEKGTGDMVMWRGKIIGIPSGYIGQGILHGDKGTVITVKMDYQWKGPKAVGFGEGVDRDGNEYQIQFAP